MVDREKLIALCADFWNIDKSIVNDKLRFDNSTIKGVTSIKLYQFFAAVESAFNVNLQNLNRIVTFGDLIRNLK